MARNRLTANRFHVCISGLTGLCLLCESQAERLHKALDGFGAVRVTRPYRANRDKLRALASACPGIAVPTARRFRKAMAPWTAQEQDASARRTLSQRRNDPAPVYTVALVFARGAHAVEVGTLAGGTLRRMSGQPFGKGWREARAARKVRGDADGLRFWEAERVRDGIARKLGASRAQRRA